MSKPYRCCKKQKTGHVQWFVCTKNVTYKKCFNNELQRMLLRKFYWNIQTSLKPTIMRLTCIYIHIMRMTRYYFIDWFILRLVLILKENISVAEDFHLAYETLATTVNLDTDIDLWSNDMSNMKHDNIGTR